MLERWAAGTGRLPLRGGLALGLLAPELRLQARLATKACVAKAVGREAARVDVLAHHKGGLTLHGGAQHLVRAKARARLRARAGV